jgi:phenylpropionate dioxygenase-like ring-hydroxylating dioxygenase large terminal subunit
VKEKIVLSKEDNTYVTQVGPGTPMGALIREYWIPSLMSEDLPSPDSNPLRVRLLGEDLIAFRTTDGEVGLIGDHCPHRGASLFFGRNEENGLRCVYHGWKFDTSGACVDMPNEPPESNFKDKIHHLAYPCVERNGVVWSYLGPRREPPPLPELGWALVPAQQRSIIRYRRDCNWLQALEGDVDSSHINFLHSRLEKEENLTTLPTLFYRSDQDKEHLRYFRGNGQPVLSVADTDVGVTYGARRPGGEGRDHWRITQFLLPFYTSIPGSVTRGSAKVWVPLDDEHTLIWEPHWSFTGENMLDDERDGKKGRVPETGYLPDTTDGMGRWRFAANQSNDYLIDREIQRTKNYTGLDASNPLQDGAVQESMGTTYDRSSEHLGSADAMVIQVRRRLIDAARAFERTQAPPPGVDQPTRYRRRGVQLFLQPGANWLDESESLATQVVGA